MDTDTALEHLRRIAVTFESLRADGLDALASVYADDATFTDPFNTAQGLAAIRAQYAHMFAKLHAPRFVVRELTAQGEVGWITWDFVYAWKPGAATHSVHGATRLRLGADGRVADHRDYWDACDFYATVPVLGGLVRALKRAARAPAA